MWCFGLSQELYSSSIHAHSNRKSHKTRPHQRLTQSKDLKINVRFQHSITVFYIRERGGHTLILPTRVHVRAAEQGVVFRALSLR